MYFSSLPAVGKKKGKSTFKITKYEEQSRSIAVKYVELRVTFPPIRILTTVYLLPEIVHEINVKLYRFSRG